jgi:xanthine dehydrogenase accessory factor
VAELSLAQALSLATAARDEGEGAAIVSVVANRGTLPVQLSSRLVVLEKGRIIGSVHPELDPVLVAAARQSLGEKKSRLRSFSGQSGSITSARPANGDLDVFFEVMARPPALFIAGAGHIAVPLAHMGKLLGFKVTVIDDRAAYANRERFPDVDELHVGPYRETLRGLTVDGDTYIVLVTRGHVHDTACLEEVLHSDAPYIGMIGSKRRVRTVLEHISAEGSDTGALKRVHAPIGLDIGAQTPEEIALAVMAEIVRVRRGGTGRSLAVREAAGAE